ncbi:sugar transferase [Arabiibacter massiliensis]|uniref:sugar transferase n=1 Tax=Arabiibacter massiliensis TaxID=1870985 RepID=UPI001E3BC6DE|nr:sugar transferase [Arabiibacter massiliensis]
MEDALDNEIEMDDVRRPDRAAGAPSCHPERSAQRGVEGSRAASAEDGRTSPRLAYRFLKRAFDIVFSLLVVSVAVILWPLAIAVFIAIAVQTKGSPIYLQERVGRYGKPLRILKLRTMVSDSDDVEKHLNAEQLEQWKRERKVDNDPRIVPVGSFLRRTSLDEMPQFLNVLTGSMSVVGVRPVVAEELVSYGDDVTEFLSLKPGITGWWQVQARNDATYEDGSRQELELYYVRNASLALDIRIFVETFGAMFGKNRNGL